ncbi:hypothetical protein GMORB2_5871 [Geosmithia morbida]|uniref:Uncharacterized protein n=1 Tax=Geosmithia morbida TaxID=1094350 RepID=A0A9P4YWI3_9HYPO|nr:uncharacterized protein GMORB2_5871 [Geosmithia morbida]KAF4124155.1 hypothetical protein GMORB2_5871 [Geosmithia morbida]
MQEFYKAYICPSSPTRAKMSIHLHAQAASELDKKITELLARSSLEDVPSEQRQNLGLLKKYLIEVAKLPEDKAASIIAEAKEFGLKAAASDPDTGKAPNGTSVSKNQPTEIKDIRRFKSGLLASSGARPVKDLSEYEDIDPKL